jgi:hypothetical protein
MSDTEKPWPRGIMEDGLYRIAQGVADPRAAARQVLERVGCPVPPPPESPEPRRYTNSGGTFARHTTAPSDTWTAKGQRPIVHEERDDG